MFPLSDSVSSRSFPFVTLGLILVNACIFFLQLTNPESFMLQYALIPSQISFSDPSTLLHFVTATFLHGGFLHIISNMWFLWIFGDDVEDHIGKLQFLAFYLIAGIIGNFAQYVLSPGSDIPMLGASGAISGVLGAYYILFPHSRIKSILVIFFFITIMEIPATIYLFYWFAIQFLSGISSLPMQEAGGVAFWAHVGGFIAGVLFGNSVKGKVLREENGRQFIEGEVVG